MCYGCRKFVAELFVCWRAASFYIQLSSVLRMSLRQTAGDAWWAIVEVWDQVQGPILWLDTNPSDICSVTCCPALNIGQSTMLRVHL